MFIMHFNCFGIAAWLEDMVNILPVHLVGALWVYLVEECRSNLFYIEGHKQLTLILCGVDCWNSNFWQCKKFKCIFNQLDTLI